MSPADGASGSDAPRAVWPDARIVVVDDDPANLRLLERILRDAGYEHVTVTSDPTGFIDDYDRFRPDLVLLDLMMPGLGGIDVLRRIRAMTPAAELVPVLMLTADTGHQAMRRALSAGVDDFLTKPFDTVEAELRIANLLRTRRLSLEVAAHNELLEREVRQRTDDLQLFRDVVETVPDPVVIEDRTDGVVFANAAIADAFDDDERADNPWTAGGLAALAPEVADGHLDSTVVEDTIARRDGTRQPVEILVHSVHRGAARLLVGIGRDISARVAARDALERALARERQAVEELTEVANLKDAFLTAVSHEIRTPLSVVNGAAQTLLRRRAELDEDVVSDLLERLAANGQRLQDMLLDLLDLNNLVRGQIDLRLRMLRLDELIRARLDATALGDRPVNLDLPPTELEGDREQLTRVLDALLTNVAKHTQPGTALTVSIEAGEPVLIRIADGGPGVPDHLKERIFAPFEHGPTTAAHSPGTGIGLTLAKTLLEAHHGSVRVEDTPSGGATFTVRIPARQPGPDTPGGTSAPG